MKNKKNVWIINQYTGSPYYGMNYRSYYLAKELVREGHDVTIFSGSYSHLFVNYPKSKGLFTKEKIEEIDYIWIKTPKYKNSQSIGRIINMLAFMLILSLFKIFKMKKPDIMIISSLSLFPVLNTYIWSRLLRIEFIFEVRDLWPLTLIEIGKKSKYHPLVLLFGWFEKLGYKKAKYVVSLLPNASEYMITRGMDKNKFRHIPNGINLEEVENYQDISDEIKSMLPTNKFVVGYLGTIGIANAMDYLLEAAKSIKNTHIHFVIVGKGGEKSRLVKYSQKYRLSNVTFIEAIPKIQVQAMLKYFDLCYIGWHKKDFYKYGISPNKIFDYMFSGKPILHSISIDNDIVKDAKCGISIEAEDSEKIKKAIYEMYSKSTLDLKRLGENGKEYVMKYHSYENITKKYLELIE